MARWFVDNVNGNDSNDGQTPQTAFYTINKAISMCSGQPPGDEIIIRPSVYDEYFLIPPSYTSFIGDISGEWFGVKRWVYMQNVKKNSASMQPAIFYDNTGNAGARQNILFKNIVFIMMGNVAWAPLDFRARIKNLQLENVARIDGSLLFFNLCGGENSVFKNCYNVNFIDKANLKYENCYIAGELTGVYTFPVQNLQIRNCILITSYRFRRSDAGEGGTPDSALIENSFVNKYVFLDDPATRTYNYDWGTILNSIIMVYQGGNQTNTKARLVRCIDILSSNYANWTIINSVAKAGKGTTTWVYINSQKQLQFREGQVIYSEGSKNASDFSYYKWSYYKPVVINNPNNYDLIDFQVMFKLDTASLITVGKMRSFCQDLRVFLDTGSGVGQELPFWIEGPENNANTIIWTKVPFIPANGSITLRVYYGNSVMPRKSDGINTFEFFDDFIFDTSNKYKWHVLTASSTYSETWNTTYIYPTYLYPGNLQINSVGYYDAVTRWDKFPRPCIIETKVKVTGGWGSFCAGLEYWVKNGYPNDNYAAYRSFTDGVYAKLYYADTFGNLTLYTGSALNLTLDTYYIHRLQLTPSLVKGMWFNADRTYQGEVSITNTDYDNCYIVLNHYRSGIAGYWAYYDWILVRKYAPAEPTFVVGDEVSGEFYLYEPPYKDMYGREPVETRDLGPIESEYPYPEFDGKKGLIRTKMDGGFSR